MNHLANRIAYVSLHWRRLQDLMMLDIIKQLVPDSPITVLCVGPYEKFQHYYTEYDLLFDNIADTPQNLTYLLKNIHEPFLLFQGDLVFKDIEPIKAGFKALNEGYSIWSPCRISTNYKHINIKCDRPIWTSPAAEWSDGVLTIRMFYFSLLALNPLILIGTLKDDAKFVRFTLDQFEEKISKLTDCECTANQNPDYFGWLATAAMLSGLDVMAGEGFDNKEQVLNAGAGSNSKCFTHPMCNVAIASGALLNYMLDYCHFDKYANLSMNVKLEQVREIGCYLAKQSWWKFNKVFKMIKLLAPYCDERCEEIIQVLLPLMSNKPERG